MWFTLQSKLVLFKPAKEKYIRNVCPFLNEEATSWCEAVMQEAKEDELENKNCDSY